MRPSRSATRRRSSVLAASIGAAALAASTVMVPTAKADIGIPLPMLWEGQVNGPDGTPSQAEVVAYARPAADRLVEGVPLTEIASAHTDEPGRFVLRAAPGSLAHVADAGGWAGVMVIATGSEGTALAVDSVSWKPSGTAGSPVPFAAGAGRWVTTPEALLSDAMGVFAGGARESSEAIAGDRPAILTLARPSVVSPMGKRPAGDPPKGKPHCAPTPRYKDVGVSPVAVGELHREANWGGEFVYTSTKSSSFQVGSSVDGKGWKVAGSMSMSKNRSARASGYEKPQGHLVFETMYADLMFTEFTWVCGEPNWTYGKTIEPTDWTGGMHDWPGVNPTSCGGFAAPVPPEDRFDRAEGSTQTLQGAIQVDGFVGSVSTMITGVVEAARSESLGVAEMWDNQTTRERSICGDTDYPAFDTRIVSLP